MGASTAQPWETFADAVLRRAGLIARIGRGRPPHEFAGLFVGDDEIDALLVDIPGMQSEGSLRPDIAEKLEAHMATARAALLQDRAEPATAFSAIAWNAGVHHDDLEVFALVCAVEASPRRQRLVAYIQDNVTLPRPTPSLLQRVFPPYHRAALALAPDAPLRRTELAAIGDEGPWATRTISVSDTVMWALAGDDSLDADLPVGSRVVIPTDTQSSGGGLVVISGGDAASRRIAAYVNTAGTGFLVVPLPTSEDAWAAVVREATVAGLGVVVEDGDAAELSGTARHWIERSNHLAWAICSAAELAVDSLPDRPWRDIHLDDHEATNDEWLTALGEARSGGHRLNREQLRLVARSLDAVGGSIDGAVRRIASGKLDRLAVRIRPRRTWNDLILPPEQLTQLQELAARYRQRDQVYEDWGFRAVPSAGVVALFAGPSGTGKTLTAEIIAGDLGLDVYKVDLSAVVSKYIGETEKNLESIFSAAAAGNVVLFFDEADSLFGKRSEVNDAHDRYANIEVSYLLQRLERYDGLVVLATNLQKNIDQAFLRRIHVAVEFPMPEEDERRAIWKLSFPPKAPITDVDFDFLAAQFKLSGGSIRNASLNAAFLSAEAGDPITMESVIYGLKREFQKLGRLRTESEFDRYFDLVKGGAHAAAAR